MPDDAEVSFLPMEAIGEDGSLRLDWVRPVADVRAGYSFFVNGDVAFAKVTPCFENGKGALMQGLTGGVGFGTTELTVLRPRPALDARFLHYVVTSPRFREPAAGAMTGAGGLKRVPEEFTRNTLLPLPPLTDQRAIADFLDRETARIDSLIGKKTRFIELLREKHKALVERIVTRGLDLSVAMKPTGLAFVPEIPSDWTTTPLKYLADGLTVGIVVNPSDYVSGEGLPFIYGGDISEGSLDLVGCRRISPEHSASNPKTRLRPGDLVTVRVGAPGVTAVVPREAEGGNCASVMLIRKGEFDSNWLCFVMNSRVVRYQVELVQYGAAQEQFNISHAVDFLIPVPPARVQRQIAAVLTEHTERLEQLASRILRSIDLLRERRAALITAAVTGQIDARAEQPAEDLEPA